MTGANSRQVAALHQWFHVARPLLTYRASLRSLYLEKVFLGDRCDFRPLEIPSGDLVGPDAGLFG